MSVTQKPTPAKAWKGKRQLDATELVLPSENVALVKQISPQDFLTSGLIPDPLTAIIQRAIHDKKGLNPASLDKIQSDPDMLRDALILFDRVLAHVVVEPHIEMQPGCDVDLMGGVCGKFAHDEAHQNTSEAGHHAYSPGPRDENILYADEVDLEDKTFIFQWCLGGTRDLEQFRRESATGLETVQHSKNVRGKAKRTA